jgi:hypothetical protein
MGFVQGAINHSSTSVVATAFPAGNTAGNTLIVIAETAEPFGGLTGMSINDTQGNVWVPLPSPPAELNNILPGVWTCASCKAGANTVTVTYGYGAYPVTAAVLEYSNLGALDVHAVTEATSSVHTITSVTTTHAGDILIGLCLNEGTGYSTPSNTSGWTSDFVGTGSPVAMGLGAMETTAGAAGAYSLTAGPSSGSCNYQYLYVLAFQSAVVLTAQTITFAAIPNHSVTDAPFTLAPTASSGLTVSLAVTSGPATISGDTVTLTGATGTVTIQATQAGNGTYAAATPVSQSFTVSTAAQTITFPAISDHAPTDAPFTLGATASSGLAVSYAVTSGPATVSGSTVTLTGGLGTVTIQATQAGNGTYAAATAVNQSFTVVLTPQTITFGAIPGHSTTDAPFTLAPSASSGLTVSVAVTSGPATISGNVVTLNGTAGTVAIQATQAGNGTYAAATPVNQLFAVSLAPQTITFGAIPGHVANDPPFTLAPTASSGLAVSLAVTAGPATLAGDVVTFTGSAGTVTIQATQAGNGTYAPATPVSQSFTVAASQRGNTAYDQIRTSDRTGNGPQLLTYTIPAPASATSAGTPGQIAFDAAGNWYWCYAVNSWARIGPAGYGSAAASPPSW